MDLGWSMPTIEDEDKASIYESIYTILIALTTIYY